MTKSEWSKLHPVQQLLVVLGLGGFVTTLVGLVILNGLSLALGLITIGIVLMVGSIIIGFMTVGLGGESGV